MTTYTITRALSRINALQDKIQNIDAQKRMMQNSIGEASNDFKSVNQSVPVARHDDYEKRYSF